MNCTGRQIGLLTVMVGLFLTSRATGQIDTNNLSVPAVQRTIPGHIGRKSPVAFFRELLDMSSAKRDEFLSRYRPEIRTRIEAKLEEYQSLGTNDRELRLRTTELYWYLRPLMSMSREERTQRLEQVPADLKQLIENRLDVWDLMPPPLKDDLLENEMAVRYFTRAEPNIAPAGEGSPRAHQRFEEGIQRWKTLPPDQRRIIESSFNQFFELTSEEKTRTLEAFSETEQQQMQKTLESFEKMPAEQRATCIRSFEKFAAMNPRERQEFLANAERWNRMSREERQQWRDLVSQIPDWPPLPPGLSAPLGTNIN